MTRVSTSGMSSCATIAISGFKQEDYEMEMAHQKDPSEFSKPASGMSCWVFYNNVLYPTSQPLGKTGEYAFSALMAAINESSLKTKLITVALPSFQISYKDYFWPKLLKEHGFEEVAQTKNTIGSVNVIFIRNPNPPSEKQRVVVNPEEVVEEESVFG